VVDAWNAWCRTGARACVPWSNECDGKQTAGYVSARTSAVRGHWVVHLRSTRAGAWLIRGRGTATTSLGSVVPSPTEHRPERLRIRPLEHKSSPDSAARLQLLRYIVRILVNWYEQNGRRLPLPPVLPLLVHQGPGDWKSSCEFVDLFGAVPEILRPHLPSFRHMLVDLGRVADERLSAQPRLRAHLKALKYARRQDLLEKMDVLLAEAPVLEVLDVALSP
jgi:hypothetical protein